MVWAVLDDRVGEHHGDILMRQDMRRDAETIAASMRGHGFVVIVRPVLESGFYEPQRRNATSG